MGYIYIYMYIYIYIWYIDGIDMFPYILTYANRRKNRSIRNFEVSTPLRPACLRIPAAHEAPEPGGATTDSATESDHGRLGVPSLGSLGSATYQGWVNSAEFTCEASSGLSGVSGQKTFSN